MVRIEDEIIGDNIRAMSRANKKDSKIIFMDISFFIHVIILLIIVSILRSYLISADKVKMDKKILFRHILIVALIITSTVLLSVIMKC